MDSSFDSNVRGNEIHENWYGIWSMDSGSSTIVANNIAANVVLNIDTNNCTNSFYYNNIVNPSPGQVDEWGPATSLWDDGGVHPCPTCSGPHPKGNYWSDYTGLDNGLGPPTPSGHKCALDDVGDTLIPHMPTTGAPPSDWYPLVIPWVPNPGDINLDGKVDMRDIGFTALRFGISWSEMLWDPRADMTGPTSGIPDGKTDMRDIGLTASHFGYTDC
jgi:parallel beta-helix repeat protein